MNIIYYKKNMKFLNVNGIPGDNPVDRFFLLKSDHHISICDDYTMPHTDTSLIELGSKISRKLFGSTNDFYEQLASLPLFYSHAGLDAECAISKDGFVKCLNDPESEINYKFLYYFDVENLVSSLSNLSAESYFLFCNFFEILNENSFMLQSNPINRDIITFSGGRIVIDLFSCINHLFINMASQLDFITKIAYEMEHMPCEFTNYQKMKSNKILYSDFNKINNLEYEETVFVRTDMINFIVNLRNEVIHNASFERDPKIYQVFKNNEMIEKFILVPDYTNGLLDRCRNRSRFFSKKIKLNEMLPDLIMDFWNRMDCTIKKLSV